MTNPQISGNVEIGASEVCARCLYPRTKPDLTFNEHGVCSACTAFDKRKLIDWPARKRELEILLEKGRNSSGFDCIVPSSGGKDSHWQVLTLLEMGAKPLVVTATTCHLTDIGRKNIDNLARYATTVEFSPNKTVRAKLNRIGLLDLGDISHPEHMSIFSTPFRAAAAFGIPLLFYGESPTIEYGGPEGSDGIRVMNRRWVSEFGGLLGMRANDFIGKEGITERDMADYVLPADADLSRIEAHFLGTYLPWDSHRNGQRAAEAGMSFALPSWGNCWAHENLDNAQTGLHDWFIWLKYGYCRSAAQLSVDVRYGIRNRESAKRFLRKFAGVFPYPYMGVSLAEVLSRIDVSMNEYREAERRFTNREIFGDRDPRHPNAPDEQRAVG